MAPHYTARTGEGTATPHSLERLATNPLKGQAQTAATAILLYLDFLHGRKITHGVGPLVLLSTKCKSAHELVPQQQRIEAVEITFDGKRYFARSELVGHVDLAFRALGIRPPLRVTELPRPRSDLAKECCGT